jgi:hypothetical protein
VIKVVFIITERLVPQSVVASNLSRFLSNFKVIFILDGGTSGDFLIFLGLADIRAISDPEKKASKVRHRKKMTM